MGRWSVTGRSGPCSGGERVSFDRSHARPRISGEDAPVSTGCGIPQFDALGCELRANPVGPREVLRLPRRESLPDALLDPAGVDSLAMRCERPAIADGLDGLAFSQAEDAAEVDHFVPQVGDHLRRRLGADLRVDLLVQVVEDGERLRSIEVVLHGLAESIAARTLDGSLPGELLREI